MSHFTNRNHTFMSHFAREIHTFMSHFATAKAANLFQPIPSAERKRLVLLEEGTPKPPSSNFRCLKEDPLAKTDAMRKPKIHETGIPRSFLAPALRRKARNPYLRMKSAQIEEVYPA